MSMIKESMLSSQERESDIREKMQEFAKKSLSMDPTDLSRALDSISDKETECLIGIYESYRSDPSKKSQEFTITLNMTLASQKQQAEAYKTYCYAWPPPAIYNNPDSFPEKSDWIECRKEYEQVYKKSPIGTEQDYEEAYEKAKVSFEKARDKAYDIERKASKQEDSMCESFGKLSPTEQLRVLDSISRASTDMLCREKRLFSTIDDRRTALNDTFDILVNIHAKQIGQSPDSVKRSVNECLGGWPPRIPDAYRNGEIKKVEQHNQQHNQQPNKLKSSRH